MNIKLNGLTESSTGILSLFKSILNCLNHFMCSCVETRIFVSAVCPTQSGISSFPVNSRIVSIFQISRCQYEVSAWRKLQPKELWARAYAQYIASKRNAQGLIEQLSSIHDYEHLSGSPVPPSRQWDTDDFEGVSVAMDSIFGILGWQIDQSSVPRPR